MNETKAGYSQLSDCALRVQVTVVSKAVQGRAMIDGGSKTFSGDRLISGDKQGFGLVTELPNTQFAAMSEEHGHLDLGPSDQVHVGAETFNHSQPRLRLREHAQPDSFSPQGRCGRLVDGRGSGKNSVVSAIRSSSSSDFSRLGDKDDFHRRGSADESHKRITSQVFDHFSLGCRTDRDGWTPYQGFRTLLRSNPD